MDLTFPESDINDLLKSMVLEDFNDGRIAAVSATTAASRSRAPSPRFAINLNGQPDLRRHRQPDARRAGRSRRVSPTAANQPGKLTGTIVGVEKQKVPAGNADGRRRGAEHVVRRGPAHRQAVRRAADCGSRTRSSRASSAGRWKSLALSPRQPEEGGAAALRGRGQAQGAGRLRRRSPIWKTSYRLVLAEKEKPYLQGWAVVENPTDEDWAGVRMALISGRPDLLQDGPVQPAVRRPAHRRTRTVRLAAARHLPRRIRQGRRGQLADARRATAPTTRDGSR